MPAKERVEGVRDVPGGEDVRIAGAQRRVHHDPIVDPEPGVGGEGSVGAGTDADEHVIGGNHRAVGQPHTDSLPASLDDLADGDAAAQVDPVCRVQIGEDGGQLRAEYAQQWQVGRLEDGDRD